MASASCVQYETMCDAYGGEAAVLGKLETTTVASAARPAVDDGYGAIPFTGFDVFLIVAGGLIALAAGLLARRGSKAPAQSSG